MRTRPALARRATRIAGVVALALPAAAQLPVSGSATLAAELRPDSPTSELHVALEGASGPAFLWLVAAGDASAEEPGPYADWLPAGTASLQGGEGSASLAVPNVLLAQHGPLVARAVFLEESVLVQTAAEAFATPDEEPLGDPFDFDWGSGAVPLAAGTLVSEVQPWSDFVTVRATNANPAHPNELVLFDSSAAGADPDLVTPGPGAGNDEALGMLLVIAANDVDLDGDRLVDVPDAEDAGGTIVLEFEGPSAVSFLRLIDVDEGAAEVRWYAGDEMIGKEPVPAGGDNSVYVTSGELGATRVEVDLPGSAGIGTLDVYPCEAAIGFDTLTTGVPVPLEAGADVTDGAVSSPLLGGLGLFLLAENAHPTHPDRGILFDTAAPTGGDFDLATPGYGAGNDEPLGKVLVIAEDDVDADGDGLVDDPDDEALGGVLTLGWYTSTGRFRGATLLDVDAGEDTWIEIELDDGSGTVVIPVEPSGDNSVCAVEADVGPTRLVEFHLGGSTGLAEVRVCPSW